MALGLHFLTSSPQSAFLLYECVIISCIIYIIYTIIHILICVHDTTVPHCPAHLNRGVRQDRGRSTGSGAPETEAAEDEEPSLARKILGWLTCKKMMVNLQLG